MDDGISFGEIEQTSPQKNLRPDRNKHFAVAPYGEPKGGELPIFVDLDVARDMEAHAQSDTSVELGGVLLGGQCEDDEGRPFIVVTDSLRAAHYESTKGSFKFTHDTWSAISRQRDEFPPELQMVGWYHTHPDWGVFLSGMDMFICDNFFNKTLDIAYVIDPCRGDRGMFQWTGDPRQRVRRTAGFYLTASRFRQAELENYVAQLEGKTPTMPSQYPQSGFGAPIINVTPPRDTQPQWQGIAILGMLALQFGFLALLAWKLLTPPQPEARNEDLARLVKEIEEWHDSRRLETLEEGRREVFDRMMVEMKGAEPGFTEKVQREAEERELFRSQALRAKEDQDRLTARIEGVKAELAKKEDDLDVVRNQVKIATTEYDAEHRKLVEARKTIDKLNAELHPEKKGEGKETADNTLWWALGGGAAALLLIAALLLALKKPPEDASPDESGEIMDAASSKSKTDPPPAN